MNRSTNRAKADAYLKAAKSIERGREYFACFALDDESLCDEMRRIFRPRAHRNCAWLSNIGAYGADRQNGRVLALCFMAAMVEAGDA